MSSIKSQQKPISVIDSKSSGGIEDGITGFLVCLRNIKKMIANKMDQMVREHVTQYYNLKEMVSKTDKIYKTTLIKNSGN